MNYMLHQQNNMGTTCSTDRKDKKRTQNFSRKTRRGDRRNLGANAMPFSFNTSALCYGSGFFWIVILKIYFCTLYNVTSKRDKNLSDFTIYAKLYKQETELDLETRCKNVD
jgi:hypothetical protein